MPQSVDKTANSSIMVVASDPKFLKYLEMALKLEFEHEILSLTKGKEQLICPCMSSLISSSLTITFLI